jgi:peptidoglycan/LPS O-acetylase OafA/YrhL
MEREGTRLHALDAARGLAMALVLSLHCLASFIETPIGWAIKDRSTHVAADFAAWAGRAFLMPAFFLLAGLFSRMSVERGGLRAFARERAKRVLVPLLVALVPVSMAMNALWDHGRQLAGRADVGAQVPVLRASELPVTLGHLWYLYYLLVISALAVVLPRRSVPAFGPLPLLASIPVAALLLLAGKLQLDTPLSFLIEPSIAAYFAVFFVWGWLLDRVELDSYARRLPLLLGALAALLAAIGPALLASASPGAPARAPASALVASAMFSCISVATFLGACSRLLARERPFFRLLADSSYWTYVVHLPLAVFLQIQVASLPWPGPIKYVAIVVLTAATCLVTWRAFHRAHARYALRAQPPLGRA